MLQRVQNTPTNYSRQNMTAKKSHVNFGATPAQIFKALDTAHICPGKAGFLTRLADAFAGLEKKLAKGTEFVYRLGEKNKAPAKSPIAQEIAGIDQQLNKGAFQCGSGESCACGKGLSLGGFAKQLLQKIGVEKPDVIEIANK